MRYLKSILLILLLLSPSISLAQGTPTDLLLDGVDNFIPLSEGDPSTAPGFASGDENPFRGDLSDNVSKGLPSAFVNSQNRTPLTVLASTIRYLLGFLGMGAVIIIVYAGFRWMTSAGNEDAVKEAKTTLRNALIGLILILMSYSLATFVVRRLQKDTASFGSGGTYGISTDGVELGPVGTFR